MPYTSNKRQHKTAVSWLEMTVLWFKTIVLYHDITYFSPIKPKKGRTDQERPFFDHFRILKS